MFSSILVIIQRKEGGQRVSAHRGSLHKVNLWRRLNTNNDSNSCTLCRGQMGMRYGIGEICFLVKGGGGNGDDDGTVSSIM